VRSELEAQPGLPGGHLLFHERIATSSTPSNRSLKAQNCFRSHNQQRITMVRMLQLKSWLAMCGDNAAYSEPSACQDPKAPIGVAQARPRMPPLQHNQLLPETRFSAISSAFGLKMATMAKTSNRNT
jgi:hypothetical protein